MFKVEKAIGVRYRGSLIEVFGVVSIFSVGIYCVFFLRDIL